MFNERYHHFYASDVDVICQSDFPISTAQNRRDVIIMNQLNSAVYKEYMNK